MFGRSPLAALLFFPLAAPAAARNEIVPRATEAVNTAATPFQIIGSIAYFQFDDGAGHTVAYAVDANDVLDGRIDVDAQVDGGAIFSPVEGAGVRLRDASGALQAPGTWGTITDIVPSTPGGTSLQIDYVEDVPGDGGVPVQLKRTHRFSLAGSALRIELFDTSAGGSPTSVHGTPYYAGFQPGTSLATPAVRSFRMPYSRFPVGAFRDDEENVFYGAYTDPTVASSLIFESYQKSDGAGGLGVGMYTENQLDTAGDAAALNEVVYVVASNDLLEVLPRFVPSDPTDYRDGLEERVLVDDWGFTGQYQQFGGVEVVWTAPTHGKVSASGSVQALGELHYALGVIDSFCEEVDVRFAVLLNDELLYETLVEDVVSDPGVVLPPSVNWTLGGISVEEGDELRFQADAAGFGFCDFLLLNPVVEYETGPMHGTVYDGYTQFIDYCSLAPPPAAVWSYRDFFRDTWRSLSFNDDECRWDSAVHVPFDIDGAKVEIAQGWIQALSEGGLQGLVMKPTPFMFLSGAQWMRDLHAAGMRDLAVINHLLARNGFDSFPDQHPVNEAFAMNGEDALAEFAPWSDTAKALGFAFGMHENYNLMAEWTPARPNEYWATGQDDIALDSDGEKKDFQPGKFHMGFEVSDYYADLEFQQVADLPPGQDYDFDCAYLDAITAYQIEAQVDLDATTPTPKTSKAGFELKLDHFDTVALQWDGPVFGEGGDSLYSQFDSYYAGHVHGTERQLYGRLQSHLLPDFELEFIRPWMANQGMGWHFRYFPFHNGEVVSPTEDLLDRLHAQTVGYGHVGMVNREYLEPDLNGDPNWVDHPTFMHRAAEEYYFLRAAQERLLDVSNPVESIVYEIPGVTTGAVPLEELVATGENLANARITVDFADDDLRLYSNFHTGRERYTPFTDFSAIPGQNHWYHREERSPGNWVDMEFDPFEERYIGAGPGVEKISAEYVSTTGDRLARVFRIPENGDWDYSVDARFPQGDDTIPGAAAHLTVQLVDLSGVAQVLVSMDLDYHASVHLPPTTLTDLRAGEELYFIIDHLTVVEDVPDSVALIPTIERQDLTDPTWSVTVDSNQVDLPTYGWAVTAMQPRMTAMSALATGGERVEYVESNDYDMLRTRSGALVSFLGLQTDGMGVAAPGVGPAEDLHLFQGTQFGRAAIELDASAVADVHVIWDSSTSLRILPDHTPSRGDVDIEYVPGLTFPPATTTVTETAPWGEVKSHTAFDIISGGLRLRDALPGREYSVSW